MLRLLTFGYTFELHRHYKTVEKKTNIYKYINGITFFCVIDV